MIALPLAALLALPAPRPASTENVDAWSRVEREIARGHYDKAMGAFTDIRVDCEGLWYEKIAPCLGDANFRLASLFFREEKKKEAQNRAELLLQDFILLHPVHVHAVEARFMLAVIVFRRIISHEKDVQRAKVAEDALVAFLYAYPDSPFSDQARDYLRRAREVTAMHHLNVAQFYLRRRALPAAASRARELLQDYPEFPDLAKKAQEILDKTEK